MLRSVPAPLGFDNTFALVVRSNAEEVRTISDLAKHPGEWRAGFGYEFKARRSFVIRSIILEVTGLLALALARSSAPAPWDQRGARSLPDGIDARTCVAQAVSGGTSRGRLNSATGRLACTSRSSWPSRSSMVR